DEVRALVETPTPPRWFVLVTDGIDDVDFTAGQTVAEVAAQLKDRGITFAIALARGSVRRELDAFGVTAIIGANRYFETPDDARAAFRSSTQDGADPPRQA